IHETGVTAFRRAHPEWDGRGVRIGVLDGGVDLDHPALQRTSTGARKIVDWVTSTDPLVDADPTWLAMRTQVKGPAFTSGGRRWRTPRGEFRLAVFSEAALAGEFGGDVDRDGGTRDTYGVLYDPRTHDVR